MAGGRTLPLAQGAGPQLDLLLVVPFAEKAETQPLSLNTINGTSRVLREAGLCMMLGW